MQHPKKTEKTFRIILAPEYAVMPGTGEDRKDVFPIERTFDREVLYVRGTDTYVAAGTDFDYFCVRAADGSTCFTVPAYKIRYCTERQRKSNSKVLRPKAVV